MDDQSQARDPAGAPPGRATPDFSAEHQAALHDEAAYRTQPERVLGGAETHADTHAYTPGLSRKVLFGLLGTVVLVFAAGSAWVGYEVATGSAIDRLGKSVTPAAGPAALPAPVAPAGAMAGTPAAAPLTEPSGSGLLPPELAAGPTAPPALPSAEELLAGPKKPDALLPAPAALTRDLPDWLVIEVGGAARAKPQMPPASAAPAPALAQTSGGSADETAAPAAKAPAAPRRAAQERASSVFARCPKPGESGAVECRRAVCSGAARKQAACSAYTG
ncbi:hypothetical protein [Massilia sp. YMA4]|uniref:hypothetical protein n=1 Tax=Massilia sp. YMA4 TaxID=1593482 RepID=UPI000DD18090|nr:hypothetical protein [Massilia sp. YMA4]AXA90899.1 hypothetical protein DPH57_06820 [Massilia sp. YMA4]